MLVGLPQSPARRRPDRHPEAAWTAAARVTLMAGDTAPLERTAVLPAALPALARHLAQHSVGRVATTPDGPLQAAVESLAALEASFLDGQTDLAAIVMRNRGRAVLAYLDGAHFLAQAAWWRWCGRAARPARR